MLGKILITLLVVVPPLWMLLVILAESYNPMENNDDWDN